MKSLSCTVALVLFSWHLFCQVEGVPSNASLPTENQAFLGYISRFQSIAIEEMHRTGIPASIKLAQAILESGGGQSELALQANNHFGIKCGLNWGGRTYQKRDDDKDAAGNPILSCFRKYNRPEESFYDHSEFICDPSKYARYGFLFLLDQTDYVSWARGLESAGYASGAGYADRLLNLIGRYALHQYDAPPISLRDSTRTDVASRVGRTNRVKVVFSKANERLDDIAMRFDLSVEQLVEYNDHRLAPGTPLNPNTRVFIQEKRKKWRGQLAYHIVQEGQTMFELSQRYGIKLSTLLERNGLKPGQEPAIGEPVRLRGRPLFGKIAVLRLRGTESGINSP